MTVFVAAEGTTVIGVYSTKESAMDAADTYSVDATKKHGWQRYDGAWQKYISYPDSEQQTLRVTECEVES